MGTSFLLGLQSGSKGVSLDLEREGTTTNFAVNQIVAPSVLELLQGMEIKGAVYRVPVQACFQSIIFTVPKPDGSNRLILDLSVLNKFIQIPAFKMTNHNALRQSCLTLPG